MFREIEITPDVTGSAVTFRFSRPVSVLSATVANGAGEEVRTLRAEEFQPLPEGSVVSISQVWPMDEAPAEMLALLRQVEEQVERRLAERGPAKPLMSGIEYGLVPKGYKSEQPAPPLPPGHSSIIVFAEQGQGAASFEIPALE
jgi:hypothetical protein